MGGFVTVVSYTENPWKPGNKPLSRSAMPSGHPLRNLWTGVAMELCCVALMTGRGDFLLAGEATRFTVLAIITQGDEEGDGEANARGGEDLRVIGVALVPAAKDHEQQHRRADHLDAEGTLQGVTRASMAPSGSRALGGASAGVRALRRPDRPRPDADDARANAGRAPGVPRKADGSAAPGALPDRSGPRR